VSELTNKSETLSFELDNDHQEYIYCFEGSLNLGQYPSLGERYSLKIYCQVKIEFTLSSDKALVTIIEMPQ
jgi:hypothetical protein